MAPIHNSSSTSQSHDDAPSFTIRQYEPQDHAQVAKLISDGLLHYAHADDALHDFWVDYIQRSLLSDVADIPDQYLTPGSNFFVVTTTSTGPTSPEDGSFDPADEKGSQPTIVATIGVKRQSDSVAQLKRVSVKAAFRRFGIGRLLLGHVFAWAKEQHEYEKIVLSCTATQLQAIAFYESLGFTCVKRTVRLTDPYLELMHFEKSVV